MIQGFLILFGCQLVGELLVYLLAVPIPGSVVGMVLLLLLLMLLQEVPSGLRQVSEGLLKMLPLLLVPAGVGLMTHFQFLSQAWFELLISLFVSTLITMLLVAFILKAFASPESDGEEKQ